MIDLNKRDPGADERTLITEPMVVMVGEHRFEGHTIDALVSDANARFPGVLRFDGDTNTLTANPAALGLTRPSVTLMPRR